MRQEPGEKRLPELTIKRLGHQGDGIAEGDIFAPFTLPGEVVMGEVSGNRMAAPTILTPASERVKPPCPHFKSCGGCALQHASDAFLADWKTGIMQAALGAQGLTAGFLPIVTSPVRSRRRATLAGRRTKKGALVGFYGRGSDVIMPIASCTLLHPDIIAAIPRLEQIVTLAASRKGKVNVAVTYSPTGLDVDIGGAKAADGPLLAKLGAVCRQLGFARLSWNGEVIATRTPPAQMFGTALVTPPPGGFLQATEAGQAALTGAVLAAIGPAKHVADLFAGCGTFTLPLAERAEVAAYEADAAALNALDRGWREASGLKRVTSEARDLFRRPLLPTELEIFAAVVIDPPRAGARAQAEMLAQSAVKRIAFVSCNPVTFARDAAILTKGGYRLEQVQIIDQFRWSPHVELVAGFSRG